MKILGIDIGAGTKDILLYDSEKNVENCTKMVMPSPTILCAKNIRNSKNDLYISGHTIGGGELATTLKRHIENGHKVTMTEEAAFTLYNRLERVKSLGITIEEKPADGFSGEYITFDEVNADQLRAFLLSTSESLEGFDAIAIAVQDHGVPPANVSQNRFRLEKFKERFLQEPHVDASIFFDDVPQCYVRMRSAVTSVKKSFPGVRTFVMDSTLAAMAGCLYDHPSPLAGAIAANIGNSHVTASLITDRIVGFVEHHTSLLTPEKLGQLLRRLGSGKLMDEEVIGDGGHGSFYLTDVVIEEEHVVLATGPRRMMIGNSGVGFRFAAPTGDVMMTGAFGLVKAVEKFLLKTREQRSGTVGTSG